MLRPRTFVLALLAGALGLLAATMAVNFVLDPQYVFGTPLSREDDNANYRYHRLREYQVKRGEVDGLLFASSRGKAFEPRLLAEKLGAGTAAKFDVTAGMITDHLPALEYVLRDKVRRGEKIKAVLLLLDVDTFGKLPSTNVNIDSFLPPEESGEHPARFWWRYLTVFQFRMWRGIMVYRWGLHREGKSAQIALRRPVLAGIALPSLGSSAHPATRPVSDVPRARLLVATRPNMATHLDLVARFVALCRAHGVALTVATTPMRLDAASLYDPADLRDVVERLSHVVPIWDFAAPPWLAGDTRYWDDRSHFKPEVAAMMLERMFGTGGPFDFGTLRDATKSLSHSAELLDSGDRPLMARKN
jgi:hypothetical protein